jgi:ATP-dependent RNA helicase RhlE
MSFEELNLIEPITSALKAEGYIKPTPIQEQAIPVALNRRDILGCAQTGTGKTAAFALPILQILCGERENLRFRRTIKTLILTPTRELAIQIGESFTAYGKNIPLRHGVIFGGVPQRAQTEKLKAGIDILIATPGRLLDLMDQKYVDLSNIKIFVLDEADRMLDMGFLPDVKRVIAKLPKQKQTLFFSATMPPEISGLADTLLNDPVKIAVTPISSTVDIIKQSLYFVDNVNKKSLLIELLKDTSITSALIFTRTKHGANKIAKSLTDAGINADAIHGNKSQGARQRALNNFKSNHIRALVATDIAARGIDIDELSLVINYDLPEVPETYVHRIGRTGRAGLEGTAISFCDNDEKAFLKEINKLISFAIPVVAEHPYKMANPPTLEDINRAKKVPVVRKSFSRSSSTGIHFKSKDHFNSSSSFSSSSTMKIKLDDKKVKTFSPKKDFVLKKTENSKPAEKKNWYDGAKNKKKFNSKSKSTKY